MLLQIEPGRKVKQGYKMMAMDKAMRSQPRKRPKAFHHWVKSKKKQDIKFHRILGRVP